MDKQKTTTSSQAHVLETRIAELRYWYASPQGRYVLTEIEAIIKPLISDIFGYFAVELGPAIEAGQLLQGSRINNCLKISTNPACDPTTVDLVAQGSALPLAFDNIDLMIAYHALDYSQSPHQVLREIERVLLPEGHLLLIAFNPISFRGLGVAWKKLWRQSQHPNVYTGFRMRDWMEVLGFEVVNTQTVGFQPLLWGERTFRYLHYLDRLGLKYQPGLGNVQIIHARKKVSRVIPFKPKVPKRAILQPGVVTNTGTYSNSK